MNKGYARFCATVLTLIAALHELARADVNNRGELRGTERSIHEQANEERYIVAQEGEPASIGDGGATYSAREKIVHP